MANTLVAPADLTAFPGAPFDDTIVDAAAAAVRHIAGWDIFPQQSDVTVTVDGVRGQVIVLPTLKVTAVSEVRDVTDGGSTALTGWAIRRNSMLYRYEGWPCRLQSIEVDMTHGYTALPDDLLPVIAEMCQLPNVGQVSQKNVGSFSVSYRSQLSMAANATLNRYSIHVS